MRKVPCQFSHSSMYRVSSAWSDRALPMVDRTAVVAVDSSMPASLPEGDPSFVRLYLGFDAFDLLRRAWILYGIDLPLGAVRLSRLPLGMAVPPRPSFRVASFRSSSEAFFAR